METSSFTVTKITASDNHYLTQSILPEGSERIFSKVAFLAQDQPADYWREATEDEYQEWLKSKKDEEVA